MSEPDDRNAEIFRPEALRFRYRKNWGRVEKKPPLPAGSLMGALAAVATLIALSSRYFPDIARSVLP